MNYKKLKELLLTNEAYESSTDEELLSWVLENVSSRQSVHIDALVTVLRTSGSWVNVVKDAKSGEPSDAALAAVDIVEHRTDSGLVNIDLPVFQSMQAALLSAGLITQDDIDNMGALADVSQPRWSAFGVDRQPALSHITVARSL